MAGKSGSSHLSGPPTRRARWTRLKRAKPAAACAFTLPPTFSQLHTCIAGCFALESGANRIKHSELAFASENGLLYVPARSGRAPCEHGAYT